MYATRKVIGLTALAIIYIPGCGRICPARVFSSDHHTASIAKDSGGPHTSIMWNHILQIPDIPIPLQAELVDEQSALGNEGVYCTFLVPDSYQEIMLFYDQEMERFGWRKSATFSAENSTRHMMVFDKPGHQAVIILSPWAHDTQRVTVTFYYLISLIASG